MDTVSTLWYIFGILCVLEITLPVILPLWQDPVLRQVIAFVTAVGIAVTSAGIVAYQITLLSLLIAFISVYRLLNLLRVIENRANSQHLRKITLRTSLVLIGLQSTCFLVQAILNTQTISLNTWLYLLVGVQVLVALVLLASTIRRMQKTQLHTEAESLATSELPTVTVAIPARNETEDLEACLHALIASDYPKLEILVLDDCSQTKRTPEIIRSFAHDGVRFVKGEQPRENWLAKNQAYEKLAHEASGEIILFCGVDIRLSSGSIRQLVTEMVLRKKRMMSILPLRQATGRPQHALVQSVRYLWELTPPRRLFRRPPVLSSCWLVYKKDLKKYGGFAAVSRMILPEAYFAQQSLQNDGYSFVRANPEIGVVSTKTHAAQRSTAIRTRYPQLRRRPENVLLLTLAELVCFVAPLVLAVLGLFNLVPIFIAVIATIALLLLIVTHALVCIKTGTQTWYIAVFSFIPVVLIDLVLMHVSLQRYEFSEVIWKDRNICIPVMHVIPSLPSNELLGLPKLSA